jgi:hypothetical protein
VSESSVLLKAISKIKDNDRIKKSSSVLSECAWRINQILSPIMLKDISIKEIDSLFIKTALCHIYSIKDTQETVDITDKVSHMENQAIGGGSWL